MDTIQQELYPNIPPTKMRNRKEVFRKPSNIPFWHAIADFIFYHMVKNRFFSALVKNVEAVKNQDSRFATVYYAPHNNWWDGILAYNIMRHVAHVKKFRVMIEEMNRFPVFQYIGSYPINKKSPQTAMESLKFTIDHVLGDKNVGFLIFPQGIIRPPHYRPEVFETGLAYMVEKAVKKYGGINLQPMAFNYCFLRQDRPEVLIEFDEPKTIVEANFDRKEFTAYLAKDFENFCDRQIANIANANFEGYTYYFKNKLHWWKRIEKRLKDVGMARFREQYLNGK